VILIKLPLLSSGYCFMESTTVQSSPQLPTLMGALMLRFKALAQQPTKSRQLFRAPCSSSRARSAKAKTLKRFTTRTGSEIAHPVLWTMPTFWLSGQIVDS